MYGYDLITILILVVICGVVLGLFLKKSKSTKSHSKTTTLIIEEESEADPVPETYEDTSKVIDVVYRYSSKKDIWVCPECEVENPASQEVCFLCHHVR